MANSDTHQYGSTNTLLIIITLGLVLLAGFLIQKHAFFFLQESVVAILVGILAGGLIMLFNSGEEEVTYLVMEPNVFYFLLLPPIIFESGFSLNRAAFLEDIGSILLYAVIGTIISAAIISGFVYLMGKGGVAEIDTSSPLESLLFGILLSATDPVATLSILAQPGLKIDPTLCSLIFGESVLNDAVSLVLFNAVVFVSQQNGTNFNDNLGRELFLTSLFFIAVCIGSIAIGTSVALACCYLCKHTSLRFHPDYEVAAIFLCAFGSFSLAETAHTSGITSVFICGIIFAQYNTGNLSVTSQTAAPVIFKSLAHLSEVISYLYIGLIICTGEVRRFSISFCVCTILVCILARFFNIFPLTYILNFGRRKAISWRMQMMQWFSGLRGPIAFVMALQLPSTQNGARFLSTTLGVVIFTTVVFGSLTLPLVKIFGLHNADLPQTTSEACFNPVHPENGIPSSELKSEVLTCINRTSSNHVHDGPTFSIAAALLRADAILKPIFTSTYGTVDKE